MKERLVELLKQDNCMNPMTCSDKCPYVDLDDCHSARLADHLLANGVIVPPIELYMIETDKLGRNGTVSKAIIEHLPLYEIRNPEKYGCYRTREEAEQKLKERKEDEGK